MRCFFSPIRMAKIKRKIKTSTSDYNVGKRILSYSTGRSAN